MPLRPWQRHLMEQDLEASRRWVEALKRDTITVTFHPWSNEMGETTEDKRQEDLNHLCRFVVAGLLMAFGQYGSRDAKERVKELWKDTEQA